MRTTLTWIVVLGAAWASTMGGAPPALAQQRLPLGGGDTLSIGGFINATMFTNRSRFGAFGQGQSAEWAAQTRLHADAIFTDADVRNTRLSFEFTGAPVFGSWQPRSTFETDFFGGNDLPPFGDEQPRLRMRLAYVDLTNHHTTLRIGQYWAPFFGEVPVSLSHVAFPLGYGGSGMVGWRFPGVYVYQDLSRSEKLEAQLQLAAFKGSGPPATAQDSNVVMAIGSGEASGLPQLEARLDLGRSRSRLGWHGYLVSHVDWQDTTGTGVPGDNLTAWGLEAGGNVRPGRLTVHGNVYYGKALGQQFAHLTQLGNIRGWGAWSQAGYDFTPRWSLWGFMGIDDPDEARFRRDHPRTPVLARQQNRTTDALLRFRAGRYALGVEWFRAVTHWSTGTTDADQVALSVMYRL